MVSGYYTDLGDKNEKKSQYFNRPWNWKKIKENQNWIIQFSSTDDPFIPMAEADHVASNLSSEYFRFEDKSHFFAPKDVESSNIVGDILRKLKE